MQEKSTPKAALWGILATLGLLMIWGLVISLGKLKSTNRITLTLPIAFDPRGYPSDTLLTYQVDYGSSARCDETRPAVMCLNFDLGHWRGKILPKDKRPNLAICQAHIRGQCKNQHFVAKIEHVRLPEQHLRTARLALQEGGGKIKLSVDADGVAQVEDLLLYNRTWHEYVNAPLP